MGLAEMKDMYQQYYVSGYNEEEMMAMHAQSLENKQNIANLIGGNSVSIPNIKEVVRKRIVLQLLKLRLQRESVYGSQLDEIIGLSDESIASNRLLKPLTLGQRTYQEGTKISKLLAKFTGHYSFQRDAEAFANDPTEIKEVKLSIIPEDMIMGGLIGNSCYSPDGENMHEPFLMSRSIYWAIAHDSKWNTRMYVLIDVNRGVYLLNYCYPRQSGTLAYSVDGFLQMKGLQRIDDANHFFTYNDHYVDATYNPYPELNKYGSTASAEYRRSRPSYHAVAKGTKGCAITGNPKFKELSYVNCDDCDRINPPEYMYDKYICHNCHDRDEEDTCWECGEYEWNCICGEDDDE